ncbi:alpha/beta fold hydrolase [Verrucomicrobiota bacterium]
MNTQEHSFWLGSSRNAPFVAYHKATQLPRRAFVFCGPFAEEKNKSQRLLVDLARSLAGNGFVVLRLDYGGTGDSLGEFSEASIQSRKRDILNALEYCREERQASQIGLLGLRLGGTLAAEIADEDPNISWLILLSPVADVPEYFRMTLRSKLIKEMLTDGTVSSRRRNIVSHLHDRAIDFEGFPITPQLYSEIEQFTLTDRLRNFQGPVLVVHASLKARMPKDMDSLVRKYDEIGAKITLEKVLCEPFWNIHGTPPFERIVNTTVSWLNQHKENGETESCIRQCSENDSGSLQITTRAKTENGLEQPVIIDLPDGFLSCIIHIPDSWQENSGSAVIFIHGWGGYRIGPHRMLINAARRFCKEGHLCLRMNIRGRGDSSGLSKDTSVLTMAEDARYAIREVKERFAASRVVLLGQCQGGNAALGVQESDGYVMWSAPPIEENVAANLRRSRFMVSEYVRKLADGKTWRKLAKGQLNYRLIREALFGHFRRDADKDESKPLNAASEESGIAGPRGQSCLFIYGEKDPDTANACKTYGGLCKEAGSPTNFHIVSGANHSFYSTKWEKEVIDTTLVWLKKHFPVDGGKISNDECSISNVEVNVSH